MVNQVVLDQFRESIDKNSLIPIYLQIKNFIKEKVEENEINTGDMLPSESMLCDLLEVSRSPIRNALGELEDEGYLIRLQGKGTFVGETKDRTRCNCRDRVIGFVIPDMRTSYAVNLLVGIEAELTKKNYSLLIGVSNDDVETEREIIDRLINAGIDGLILFPSNDGCQNVEQAMGFQSSGGVLLLIDRRPDNGDFNYVGSDNNGGAYTSARHFSIRGYQNVAFCGANLHVSAVEERLSGFSQGAINYGLNVINDLLSTQSDCPDDVSCYKLETFLKKIDVLKENAPVGIFAENDEIAIDLQKQLENAGLVRGVDFGLIGFDNSDEARYQTPTLTSVSQNGFLMGQTAAEMMVASIENEVKNNTIHILPTQLIVRQSCKIQKK